MIIATFKLTFLFHNSLRNDKYTLGQVGLLSILRFMCMLCRSLFVLFLLAIILPFLLRYTNSHYPFGIFNLFLTNIQQLLMAHSLLGLIVDGQLEGNICPLCRHPCSLCGNAILYDPFTDPTLFHLN
jgi:hypothetical protein